MSGFFRPSNIPPIPEYPISGDSNPYGFNIGLPVSKNMLTTNYYAANPTADVLFAVPAFEKSGSIIDQFAVMTGQACFGAALRIGIYSDATRRPAALLADFGIWNIGAISGLAFLSSAPLPFTFPVAGTYWYVMLIDSSSGGSRMSTPATVQPNEILGCEEHHSGGLFGYINPLSVQAPHLFSAPGLPAIFPISTSHTSVESMPFLWRRYSKIGN